MIQKLSDQDLLLKTKTLVQRERELLTEILRHLHEVNRRRLFSELGYKSLFDYAVKELSYSEDQAYRRIGAMKLSRELPEVEQKLADGSLTLSALSVAASLFRAEKFPLAKKQEVIEALAGKSRRQAEVIAQNFSSKPMARQSSIDMTPELERKIAEVKGWLAHSDPNISNGQLFEKLCDEFLARKAREMTPRKSGWPRKAASRTVPVELKRIVFQRDHRKCRQCGSRHALQYDHVKPVAVGGETSVENLRLLCRSCNQRAAIVSLGMVKMDGYLR